MPRVHDVLSPISTVEIRSIAVTYFAGRGTSRLSRPALVSFIIEAMVEEELALLAPGLRRAAATCGDIAALVQTAHRKMQERYGHQMVAKYLTSQRRLEDSRLRAQGVVQSHGAASHPAPMEQSLPALSSQDFTKDDWPPNITDERKQLLLADYIDGTKLSVAPTCAVCSRRTFSKDILFTPSALHCTAVAVENVPLDILRITDAHILERPGNHFTFDDSALNNHALDRTGVHTVDGKTVLDICNDCTDSLSKIPPQLPALSLANGNIRGYLPEHLRSATWLEERLCAPCLGSAYVFRLYDVSAPGRPEERPRVMRGHSCAFPLNTIATASKLPWVLGHSSTLLTCLVIGPRKANRSDFRKTFTVRKAMIVAILVYLRGNFKDYPEIEIDEDAIARLPEDDVPEDLEHHIVYEHSESAAQDFDSETAGIEPHPALVMDYDPATEDGITYLERHGMVDVNGSAISSSTRTASAFAAATEKQSHKLILHHGTSILSDYNNPGLFPRMFPLLYPWGIGGFEEKRAQPLSFGRHANLLLDLADPSFRQHWCFIFIVANIKSRRAIHLGSRLVCKARDFKSISETLSKLNAELVERVSQHLELGGAFSTLSAEERRIFALLKKCDLVTAHVPGSKGVMNQARATIRSYIGEFGVFQLFITLNPHPEYAPLFQVFLGDKEIDLGLRSPLTNTRAARTVQVANDPVAAADYFHFQIAATFQYLFGWDVRAKKSRPEGGLFGRIAAFFMVREHTMRGQLHGHILVWLEGGLNPSALRDKLRHSEEFQQRYTAFIDGIIQHHLPARGEATSATSNEVNPPTTAEIASAENGGRQRMRAASFNSEETPGSRAREQSAPDPRHADFERQFEADHQSLGDTLQTHKHRKTCYKGGRTSCRFQYPHEEEAETKFDAASNSVIVRIKDPNVVWHNPYLLVATRHNQDVRSVQSGQSSLAAAAYITAYATKSDETPMEQVKMINTVFKRMSETSDFHVDMKSLLTRCVMQFGRERQLHAQQVATYIRDLGDCWQSHDTVPMLSGSMLNKVFKMYGAPRVKSATVVNSLSGDGDADDGGDPSTADGARLQDGDMAETLDDDDEDGVNLDGFVGEAEMLSLSSGGYAHQVDDYLYRGDTLDDLNFYDFVKHCKLVPKPKHPTKSHHKLHTDHPNAKSHCHRHSPDKSRGIPRSIFAKLPRPDGTPELGDEYCAAMLCHFRPFSTRHALKQPDVTYEQAYAMAQFGTAAIKVIDNWQALSECDDARDRENLLRRKREATRAADFDDHRPGRGDGDGIDDPDADIHITSLQSTASEMSAETQAFKATLERSGWFHSSVAHAPDVTVALTHECPVFTSSRRRLWNKEEKRIEAEVTEARSVPQATSGILATDLGFGTVDPSTNTEEEERMSSTRDEEIQPYTEDITTPSIPPHILIEKLIVERQLTAAQALSFKIVARHFFDDMHGRQTAPLRLLMHGEAGTGKTVVVRLLRELLDRYGCGKGIMFLAPTGKAASAIGGVTQHSAFALDVRTKGASSEELVHIRDAASAKRQRYLEQAFEDIQWIFFDEVSMTSAEIMSDIDQALRVGKKNLEEPFGGVNVIFAGDLCQLPPVASTALYASQSPTLLNAEIRTKIELGRAAWLCVDKVVEFTEQMRMQDCEMAAVLSRLRTRSCTDEDRDIFNSLVLHPQLRTLRSFPNAIALAKTNETVRILNSRKAEVQAQSTSNTLVTSHADDHSTAVQSESDRKTLLRYNGNARSRWALGKVPLYMGMPVVYRGPNQLVALGVANGAFAKVAGWDLALDDFGLPIPRGVVLEFSERAPWSLTGLQPGCIPITPTTSTFNFVQENGEAGSQRVTRKQLPLQPGFAMTIHSAQGITSRDGIIVDLRSGGFEAYVAASRATTRDAIFLLAPVTTAELNRPALPRTLSCELQRLRSLAEATRIQQDHDLWRVCARRAREEEGDSPAAGPSQRRRTSFASH